MRTGGSRRLSGRTLDKLDLLELRFIFMTGPGGCDKIAVLKALKKGRDIVSCNIFFHVCSTYRVVKAAFHSR